MIDFHAIGGGEQVCYVDVGRHGEWDGCPFPEGSERIDSNAKNCRWRMAPNFAWRRKGGETILYGKEKCRLSEDVERFVSQLREGFLGSLSRSWAVGGMIRLGLGEGVREGLGNLEKSLMRGFLFMSFC